MAKTTKKDLLLLGLVPNVEDRAQQQKLDRAQYLTIGYDAPVIASGPFPITSSLHSPRANLSGNRLHTQLIQILNGF